tara:strand:+ start:1643 stop:1822 length:180 start_codon:yes stop_codon:yes gene_type:complete
MNTAALGLLFASVIAGAIVIGIFLHFSNTSLFESTDGHKFIFTKIIAIIIGNIFSILSL